MEEKIALPEGSMISHYRLVSKIGAGGMGEVYKAHDTTLDRPVALKILPPELLQSVDRVRRFMQEARSASALNHPNIVTIYEIGQVRLAVRKDQAPSADAPETIHYIAMEYIAGETLRSHLKHEDDLPKLISTLEQVAEGLAKAHNAGIIHRDLKPDNVMITTDGYAKIVDFGLAKLTERKEGSQSSEGLTQEGMVMGTAGYMSPEQVQGKHVDQRSDIFSFGCILYETIARRKPFAADSALDSMHKIVFGEPQPLSDADAAPELQRIVRKCLAKDADSRYQSVKEVAVDLREFRKRLERGEGGYAPAPSEAATQMERAPALAPSRATLAAPARPEEGAVEPASRAVKPARPRRELNIGSNLFRIGLLAAIAIGVWIWVTMPKVDELTGKLPVVAVEQLKAAGANVEQTWTEFDEISPPLRRSVIIAEDPAFFDRKPISAASIQKAFAAGAAKLLIPSPISRKAARGLYVGKTRNPLSPLRELVIAVAMDRRLTRSRILEIYLNVADFGHGAFGADAAAKHYFDKEASELTLREGSLLAAGLADPESLDVAKPAAAVVVRQEAIASAVRGRWSETSKPSKKGQKAAQAPDETPAQAASESSGK
jgi:Protein kinase domain/Transglycosylase